MLFILRKFLKTIVQRGSLEVETSSGAKFVVGDGTGKPLAFRFLDRTTERHLLLNPALALGEGFMDGRILVTKGSIYGVLDLIMSNLGWNEPHALARAWTRVRTAFRYVQQRNDVRRAARNVEHHYDLNVRLYDLFLDPDWQYSCAYFEQPGQSLEDAQLAKKRHIAAKLLVEPGHRVLDIGSGWGGLALYLAEHCGAHLTGVTLSKEQLEIAQTRTQTQGLEEQATFRLQDYRSVSEQFD